MALSKKKKLKLFQNSINFLGYHIENQTITPIKRVIQFGEKFPDQITDKKQLQRFLGYLNYILIFFKDLIKERKLLQNRLRKNSKTEWTEEHTRAVQSIKKHVKVLPCLPGKQAASKSSNLCTLLINNTHTQ